MSNNQETTIDVGTEQEPDLAVVARCLRDYLAVHAKTALTYQILRFLADESLKRLAEGKEACFNYLAIRQAVTGEMEGDASAWFSRYWKAFNGEFRQKCEEGIQIFAADQGLNFYPWISKRESDGGAGNQALISLVALPIPTQVLQNENALPEHDIAYIPAENLQLSWWARWIFDKDQIAEGWRKWLLIWPTGVWLLFVGLASVLLLYLLSFSNTPLTTRDTILLIYVGILAWLGRQSVDRFNRLMDDRMILASESMVGLKEFGVCLELFKPKGAASDEPKRARMIKYAATCPTCGAQVLLDQGEPDFPRRMVGRCQESPREHVFSFDRVTRTGYRLR
jgi:hypothetical protein